MSWADSVADPYARPIRSSWRTYVPPHLRPNTDNAVFGNSNHFGSSSSANRFDRPGRAGSSRGRGRGGGFRGRGRSWGRQTQFHDAPNSDPFDIVEKFDELEVIEDCDDVVVGGGGGGINFDAYEDIPVETSGSDVPPPVNSFAEIDLGKALIDNIKRCKYVKPTPIQRHSIPISIAGRDLMACAQTGSGKTAAFCFPIISGILRNQTMSPVSNRINIAYPSALILSPTRELSCQIHDEAKKFSHQTGVKVVVAYGGAPISQQLRNLERGVDILVATPGRLVDMIERARVSLRMIKYLALDEADRMLDMGFEPQIRRIVEQMEMPPPGARQTMLFSATFPTEIQRLASDFMSNYIFLAVGRVGSSTDLIFQKVEFVQDMDKRNYLMDLLHTQCDNGAHGKCALTLVFVETKRGADALERWLSMNGFPATAIHGDKVQMERERALKSFKSGLTPVLVATDVAARGLLTPVLVATDVAARGLDIPHVAHVINFDLPKDIDDYVHRIGRTGRAGKSGLATAFFSEKNMTLAKPLVELMQEAKQEVPPWLAQYAETSSAYGSGGGRRYGGSKFGGRDFRNSTQFNSGDYNYSSSYADAVAVADSYVATSNACTYNTPVTTDYAAAGVVDSYAADSRGFAFDQEPIVASGWD